jgi:ABC-type glutathione transport system ATPase component
VVASHAPSLIRSICDNAALMAAGRIVSVGTGDDILDEYQSILHGAFPRMAISVEPAAESASAPEAELCSESPAEVQRQRLD